jgi:ArsR family transcriptional regulator
VQLGDAEADAKVAPTDGAADADPETDGAVGDGRTDADESDGGEPTERATALAAELDRLQQLQSELSLAQRWVHGRIADVQTRLGEALDADGEDRLRAQVLAAVAGGASSVRTVSRTVEAPEPVVEDCLDELEGRDLLERTDEGWTLAD